MKEKPVIINLESLELMRIEVTMTDGAVRNIVGRASGGHIATLERHVTINRYADFLTR